MNVTEARIDIPTHHSSSLGEGNAEVEIAGILCKMWQNRWRKDNNIDVMEVKNVLLQLLEVAEVEAEIRDVVQAEVEDE